MLRKILNWFRPAAPTYVEFRLMEHGDSGDCYLLEATPIHEEGGKTTYRVGSYSLTITKHGKWDYSLNDNGNPPPAGYYYLAAVVEEGTPCWVASEVSLA